MANVISPQQEKFWQQFVQQFQTTRAIKIQIGKLYTFDYTSKLYHETPRRLPWYDAHPLSLCIGLYPAGKSRGWLGLNLHYLPPRTREYFIKKIIVTNQKAVKKNSPINLPYSDIKSAYKIFSQEGLAIIKRYLSSHMGRKVYEIPYSKWLDLVKSPGAKWVDITAAQVYRDTRKKMKTTEERNVKIKESRGLKRKRSPEVKEKIPIKEFKRESNQDIYKRIFEAKKRKLKAKKARPETLKQMKTRVSKAMKTTKMKKIKPIRPKKIKMRRPRRRL